MSSIHQNLPASGNYRQALIYCMLAVSGFSFWFLIGVPFASHRESYNWLAIVWRGELWDSLGWLNGTTWRPLAQFAAWLGFIGLDPRIFPTNSWRQGLLQCCVYLLFVLSWAIIYSAVREKKTFAIIALFAGGVFFSGYIHLFHIYGVFYVPVLLMIGIMLRLQISGHIERHETLLAFVAIVLTLWHPFATAIFLGFYFGHYLTSFGTLSWRQHVKAGLILVAGSASVLILLAISPRVEQTFNMLGFVTSYRTNEVNAVASVVAWALALITVVSLRTTAWPKTMLAGAIIALGVIFSLLGIPLLLLWIAVAFGKVCYMRKWGLLFALLVTLMLPYSGGIGGPVYALFSIALAVYITPLEWAGADERFLFVSDRSVVAMVTALLLLAITVRAGVSVPVLSAVAKPLFVERERTYQLENMLAKLASSEFCRYDLAFAEHAGNPVDSVESALTRRNRPPAGIGDVRAFWDTVLRCNRGESLRNNDDVVTITFGSSTLTNATRILEVPGANAGPATAWVARRIDNE